MNLSLVWLPALAGLLLLPPNASADSPSEPAGIQLLFTDQEVDWDAVEAGSHVFVYPPELELPGESVETNAIDPVWDSMAVESLDDTACVSETAGCPGVCRDPGRPRKPLLKRPGDIQRGDDPPHRYRMDGTRRAGHPHHVWPWAQCSTSEKYAGGFVGGGAVCGGQPRPTGAGTWGVDYLGLLDSRRVFLNWTCGRRQGGEGAYQTDGEPAIVRAARHRVHGD